MTPVSFLNAVEMISIFADYTAMITFSKDYEKKNVIYKILLKYKHLYWAIANQIEWSYIN